MSTDPLIGKRLGDYIIVDILGHGGMARVYRGIDKKLNRYAAVKVFDAHLIADVDQDEYRQRFQNEARAIARLNHPNIVGIYQFDQVGTLYYMAMSFIEGRDLRSHLRTYSKENRFMSYIEVLRIIRDIGSALDYAHKEGVIHRDIKPSNIMVTPGGRAVLTDFGLALSVSEGTQGATFGSAHYIAPEQAVSSAQAVAQSDLYSLGVVLFEMLTNRVPFNDQNAMSVALKHLNEQPPPPSLYNPNLSPSIDQVILRAMNKTPSKRFDSGIAMAQALEAAFALVGDSSDQPLLVKELPSWDDSSDSSSRSTKSRNNPPEGLGTVRAYDAPSGSQLRGFLEDAPTVTDSKKSQSTRAAISHNQRQKRLRLFGAVGALLFVGLLAVLLLNASSNQAIANQNATGTAQSAAMTVTHAYNLLMAATETAGAFIVPTSPPAEETVEPVGTPEVFAEETIEAVGTPEVFFGETDLPSTAEATVAVAAVVPTDTPTDTTTPTDAPTATFTPTDEPTATPQPTATSTPSPTPDDSAEKQVLLRYDEDSMTLFNRSDQRVDVNGLTFVQTEPDGDELIFETRRWNSGSRPTSDLPPGDCFQVFKDTGDIAEPPDYCGARHAWSRVSFIRWFWLSDDPDATFEVRRGDRVLAVCSIAAGECAVDVRRNA